MARQSQRNRHMIKTSALGTNGKRRDVRDIKICIVKITTGNIKGQRRRTDKIINQGG